MSGPLPDEPPVLTRALTVTLTVVMQTTDTRPTSDDVVAALEAQVVLPATITAAGVDVEVVGATTDSSLEVAMPPAIDAGKYGR
jgi:hypothetical protein